MRIDLESEVQDILNYLCPKTLCCRKCKRVLNDPVRKGNSHYCRSCVKPPVRKADATLVDSHCRWIYFSTTQCHELSCSVCTRFLLEPVSLTCCGNKLCNNCLQRVEHCPFCRCALPRRNNSVDRGLVQMMQLYFDQSRYSKLMALLRKEQSELELRKAKVEEYLQSGRLDSLIFKLDSILKQSREWYLECTQLRQRLSAELGELREQEFQLVLTNSPVIGRTWVKAGQLLLRCRVNMVKLLKGCQAKMNFKEMQSLWIACTLAEILNRDMDLQLGIDWLRNNNCEAWILQELDCRIEWLDEGPLEGKDLARTIELFI